MGDRKAQNTNGVPGQDPEALASLPKPMRIGYVLFLAALASTNAVVQGYDLAVMSGAGMYIQRDLKINDEQLEILTGIVNIYSLVGSAFAGRTSDWIGRRYTLVIASAILFVGSILMGFATNYTFLMIGRFVVGVGVGYGLMVAPVYTTEIAPASIRGLLTSFPEVFINFGVLLGYVSDFTFSKLPLHLGWRFMLGVAAIPAVVLAVGLLRMPESPRWLVLQGRLGDAKRVLDKTSDSQEEAQLRLADIKEAAGIPQECNDDVVQIQKSSRGEDVWRELIVHPTPTVQHILIAGIGLHFFQQMSGIDAIVLYSPRIFEKAGITSNTHKLLATVAVGFVKTSSVLVATFLLDRIGRRRLLLSSIGGMIASVATLSTTLTIIDHSGKKEIWAISVAITSVLTYVGSFSIGIGPIAWVYSSEIFPLRLRAQGVSIGVAVNRLMSGVISMSFLSFYKAVTIEGAFFIFMGVAVIAWIFVYALLPETQNKSLEEIQALFGTFFKWRSVGRALENNKRDRVSGDRDTNHNDNDNGQIQMEIIHS